MLAYDRALNTMPGLENPAYICLYELKWHGWEELWFATLFSQAELSVTSSFTIHSNLSYGIIISVVKI